MGNDLSKPSDLCWKIIKRATELSIEKMDSLRLIAGYNCGTEAEARSANKHETKDRLIDAILTEEFSEDIGDLDSTFEDLLTNDSKG